MKSGDLGLHLPEQHRVNIRRRGAPIVVLPPKIRLCLNTFTILQCAFGASVSFLVPFSFLSLVLAGMTMVTTMSAQTMSIAITSPIICGVLAPIFIPVMLPEAIAKHQVVPIPHDALRGYERFFVFLRPTIKYGIVRNALIGAYVSLFMVPLALFILLLLPDRLDKLAFVTLASSYISVNALFVIPLSIISFCTEANVPRILVIMNNNHTNKVKHLLFRALYCPLC